MNHSTTILLLGASTRAAAASALRAGWRPICADLFADADLARRCPVRLVPEDRYPRGLFELLDEHPGLPWLYTGGLENYPGLLDRPGLLGNPADAVRDVRDPLRLAELPGAPPTVAVTHATIHAGWAGHLVKPYRGSAGRHVRRAVAGAAIDPREEYLQAFLPGMPASAVFVASDDSTMMLGASRQLVGCDWLHCPRPFQYAGSIAPLILDGRENSPSPPGTPGGEGRGEGGMGRHAMAASTSMESSRGDPPHPHPLSPGVPGARGAVLPRLGRLIAAVSRLRGIFGLDFILTDDGRVCPIEVNPRYPASLEVLERVVRRPLLGHHFEAFRLAATTTRIDSREPVCHGKAIYYAPFDFVVPDVGPWNTAFDFVLEDLDVSFADVPRPGTPMSAGDPVTTFFASGETPEAVEAGLRKIAGDLDRAIGQR